MYGRAKYGVDLYGGIFYQDTVAYGPIPATMAVTAHMKFGPTITITGSATASFIGSQRFAGSVAFISNGTFDPDERFAQFSPNTSLLELGRTVPVPYEIRNIVVVFEDRTINITDSDRTQR